MICSATIRWLIETMFFNIIACFLRIFRRHVITCCCCFIRSWHRSRCFYSTTVCGCWEHCCCCRVLFYLIFVLEIFFLFVDVTQLVGFTVSLKEEKQKRKKKNQKSRKTKIFLYNAGIRIVVVVVVVEKK